MPKISFKKLHELIAGIDPVFDDSHPVMFTVAQRGEEHVDGQTYLVGLAEELYASNGDEYNAECQFIRLLSTGKIIDLQDEQDMNFDEIGTMLKEKCCIEKGCTIYLEKDCSFTGDWYYVEEKNCYDRSWFREQEEIVQALQEEEEVAACSEN